MCHINPGDKCRNGGDGNAGPGRLSKSDEYLYDYRKRVCADIEN